MTNKFLQHAQQQYKQGKFKEALDSCQQILKDDPEQPDALHLAGILLAQLKNYAGSLDYLDHAIKLEPENATFYNSKGNVLLRMNKLINATKAYYIAISLKPDYAAAYNNLGNSFYRQSKIGSAQKAYQKAIVLKPDFPSAHFNYGRLLTEQEDYDHAIKELKKALSFDEKHLFALGQLAHIYLQKKNYSKAVDYFKRRLAAQPYHTETHYNLGLALLKMNNWVEASSHLNHTIALQRNYPEANYHLATAYLKMGDHKKALNYYLHEVEIQAHLECYYNIGVLLMYQERHRDAIDYLKKALELDSSYLDAHMNIAAIYLKTGRIQKAIEHYQCASKLKPNDAEILHILSALQQKETPAAAPTKYVQRLFNQYAAYYDLHLTKHLDYCVPEQIHQAIEIDANANVPQWKILDLGCGTGLCGELFKNMAKELIGIDISPKMIDIAKQKNIYDQTIIADIHKAVSDFHKVDLILAADVLTYIGDLEMIFKNIRESLKTKGLFTFTVERTSAQPYVLQRTIRYAHSKSYIESLIERNRFEAVRFDNIVLRKHQGKPVEGFLVTLKKTI